MVLQIILADILLVARIFPRPCGARKNTTQLVKYPRVLSVKPLNKVYVFIISKRVSKKLPEKSASVSEHKDGHTTKRALIVFRNIDFLAFLTIIFPFSSQFAYF